MRAAPSVVDWRSLVFFLLGGVARVGALALLHVSGGARGPGLPPTGAPREGSLGQPS
jgi:hypothetical protein